jgi:cytoskeletal protein CcmA (bactofilin family)
MKIQTLFNILRQIALDKYYDGGNTMGLFKDFKEDFSQAVNEMMPGADVPENESQPEELATGTIGERVDVRSELSKLDGLLEQVKTEPQVDLPPLEKEPKPAPAPIPAPTIAKEERRTMSETTTTQAPRPVMDTRVNSAAVTEETSVITAGTTLTGDVASDGSFDIQGTINGNVTCNGKLVVTGTINGNSAASEIFADVAKIEGEVVSSGTVKIGAGSVIIGNISAASAVIAGAIKGDIDVQGPVVVDTSAVIMGNIKSRSVQINNGAVIEGFCSQCYAEIDVEGLFDGR